MRKFQRESFLLSVLIPPNYIDLAACKYVLHMQWWGMKSWQVLTGRRRVQLSTVAKRGDALIENGLGTLGRTPGSALLAKLQLDAVAGRPRAAFIAEADRHFAAKGLNHLLKHEQRSTERPL